MTATTHVETARSDVVGSLLRQTYLREARQAVREGRLSEAELRQVEDRAVLEAIALQEGAGLDVITDGEYRRNSWVVTIPLRPEGVSHAPLAGYEFLPAEPGWWSLWKEPDGRRAQVWTSPTRPFVTKPLEVVRDIVAEEYAFLKIHAHRRTKFTIPAPSWHRIFWHPEYSRAAYPTPEDFLCAVVDYLRREVVAKIIALDGDYVQLDAPIYAQWHVDPENHAAFEAWGHDMAAELVADGGHVFREFDADGPAAVGRGVLAGDERSPRGRADRAGAVGPVEPRAFAAEPVEGRGRDPRVGYAQRVVMLLVRGDEQDVGSSGHGKGRV